MFAERHSRSAGRRERRFLDGDDRADVQQIHHAPGADLMRSALIDFDAPASRDVNIILLRGKAR
jgi:hypothetical protein